MPSASGKQDSGTCDEPRKDEVLARGLDHVALGRDARAEANAAVVLVCIDNHHLHSITLHLRTEDYRLTALADGAKEMAIL
jgi:pyridoxine 5'-phosphate synthase PdxJ